MIKIIEVLSVQDKKRFIHFPYHLNKDEKYWIPPLIFEQKQLLNTNKNPFFENAKLKLFIAEDNNKIVGRIAAIVDDIYNKAHNAKVGFFGFFDCIESKEVASMLFDAVEKWLKNTHDITYYIGPTSPSLSDVIGVLIEGFESYPYVLMPYNKPYYHRIISECGLHKKCDMLAFSLTKKDLYQHGKDRLERMKDVILKRNPNLIIRKLDIEKLQEEIDKFCGLYNEAWKTNPLYRPIMKHEVKHMAKQIKLLIDPNMCVMAEIDGELIGCYIPIFDLNKAIKHANGKLLYALYNILMIKKRVKQVRAIIMGVHPQYQRRGYEALMTMQMYEAAVARNVELCELSWQLETNHVINLSRHLGAKLDKRYRMYEKNI